MNLRYLAVVNDYSGTKLKVFETFIEAKSHVQGDDCAQVIEFEGELMSFNDNGSEPPLVNGQEASLVYWCQDGTLR